MTSQDSISIFVGYRVATNLSGLDDFRQILVDNEYANLLDVGITFSSFYNVSKIGIRWNSMIVMGYFMRGSLQLRNSANITGY